MVASQGIEFIVSNPNGDKVFRQQVNTSAFGIASADFQLASQLITGKYNLQAVLGDTTSERSVQVKPYVLPKFKVDVEAANKIVRPEDEDDPSDDFPHGGWQAPFPDPAVGQFVTGVLIRVRMADGTGTTRFGLRAAAVKDLDGDGRDEAAIATQGPPSQVLVFRGRDLAGLGTLSVGVGSGGTDDATVVRLVPDLPTASGNFGQSLSALDDLDGGPGDLPEDGDLARLEPFGQGFAPPLARLEGDVASAAVFGADHWKLRLAGLPDPLTWFAGRDRPPQPTVGGRLCVAAAPQGSTRWGRSWLVETPLGEAAP